MVSHGQGNLIRDLLSDLAGLPCHNFEVIVTLNLPENESLYAEYDLPLKIIKNESPKGFGENHNAAFLVSEGLFFAVVNPDIRILSLDVLELLSPFSTKNAAAVAPHEHHFTQSWKRLRHRNPATNLAPQLTHRLFRHRVALVVCPFDAAVIAHAASDVPKILVRPRTAQRAFSPVLAHDAGS